jgi:hypothetical protein
MGDELMVSLHPIGHTEMFAWAPSITLSGHGYPTLIVSDKPNDQKWSDAIIGVRP